jgi:hypothetical protein
MKKVCWLPLSSLCACWRCICSTTGRMHTTSH